MKIVEEKGEFKLKESETKKLYIIINKIINDYNLDITKPDKIIEFFMDFIRALRMKMYDITDYIEKSKDIDDTSKKRYIKTITDKIKELVK